MLGLVYRISAKLMFAGWVLQDLTRLRSIHRELFRVNGTKLEDLSARQIMLFVGKYMPEVAEVSDSVFESSAHAMGLTGEHYELFILEARRRLHEKQYEQLKICSSRLSELSALRSQAS